MEARSHTHPLPEHALARRDRAHLARRRPLSELAHRVSEDLGLLARDHLELARTELSQGLRRTAVDTVGIALGGIVALIGLAMLLVTVAVALAPVLPPLWLRLLLCSGAYLVIGGVVAGAFARRLRGDAPPQLGQATREARTTVRQLRQELSHG